MKFTKFLILLLALSMLLVSCGGNGDGTVTTDDVTSDVPGNTLEPVPGSQWVATTDDPTDIVVKNIGSTKKTLAMKDIIIESNAIKDEEKFADVDSLIAAYSGDEHYIIQFTPTTDYLYDKSTDKVIMHGIVDKKYSGDRRGCTEGEEIQIRAHGVLTPPAIVDYQYVFNFDQYVFRKGYSYFVCLTRNDECSADMRYEYYLNSKAAAYEYSSVKDQEEFLSDVGGEREFDLIDEIFERYPKIESKHVWNDSPEEDPSKTYIDFGNGKKADILLSDYYALALLGGTYTSPVSVDELIEEYSNNANRMIIQFTPTENYQYNRGVYASSLSIAGTVDKIYSKGSSIEIAEGDTVDLIWRRIEVLQGPAIDGARYRIGLDKGEHGSTILRKGYSYFVCVTKTTAGYEAFVHGGTYEYATLEEQNAFEKMTRWERDLRFLDEIIKRYPKVESKNNGNK